MMNLRVDLRTQVETLILCVQAAINLGFPVRAVDNLFATKEVFQALSACLQAMVTKANCQGAAMVLAIALL